MILSPKNKNPYAYLHEEAIAGRCAYTVIDRDYIEGYFETGSMTDEEWDKIVNSRSLADYVFNDSTHEYMYEGIMEMLFQLDINTANYSFPEDDLL